ncbi:MAG TPA: dTDP-4-dehydrorhamnose reductase [Jatrophihabitans sp.]|jgi:dTDP-4-dehydrorhamnose reductase|nr:dTDP-4-dehydrorhamnose reductase [Jatrophihabitans sp.]
MRWLVIGASGQLGSHLISLLAGQDAIGLTIDDLDITSPQAVDDAIRRLRPDVVLNAAAYTAVDAAESEEATAFAVNEAGPRLLAAALATHGGRLIHVSTDYVFGGRAKRPYEPNDPTRPRTVYGRSKLAGERAARTALRDCHIVRTAWLYGGPGPNFVDTMLGQERSQRTVDVVADQVGSPTWVRDLAGGLVALGTAGVRPGVLHYVNTGQASWYELAQEVFRQIGADPGRVRPVSSAQFPRPAPRPAWSVLSTRSWTAAGLPMPRGWRVALREHVRQRAARLA